MASKGYRDVSFGAEAEPWHLARLLKTSVKAPDCFVPSFGDLACRWDKEDKQKGATSTPSTQYRLQWRQS